MKAVIVTTTCGRLEEAEEIARLVLADRLAACVQVAPVQSMYWWKDRIESEKEYVLSIKSKRSFFDRLTAKIRKHHSYDVPEIIATEIVDMEKSYGDWLFGELLESR